MNKLYAVTLALCLSVGAAFGQVNTLTQTTASAAILATDSVINVTSATGMNAPNPATSVIGTQLYVIAPGAPRGESMKVRAISGTQITVRRDSGGIRSGFPSGSIILIGQPNWFQSFDPNGSCVTASVYASPWVDTLNGYQWLCSTVTLSWVPSWGNPAGDAYAPTTAVASAAGAITPSGPLFHVTGALAITSFTLPVGFTGGSFTIIPDGAYTTTATNNIALASTGVVSKPQTWTYDQATAKFYPSY
jgi:hypothetical protein